MSVNDAVPSSGSGQGPELGEKGLRANAIGFVSSTVIGVASTAPGYSLAATLGFVAAAVGIYSPAIFIVAFIPMLFIAASYYYLNRSDPDCGTTFTWVTNALGPRTGWMNGWAIIVADVIVMANLAQIAGLYTFHLFGLESAANSVTDVTVVGVVWILVMTWIVGRSVELSARTQNVLLGAELFTLLIFSVVALVKVYSGHALPGSMHISLEWFNPFGVSSLNALIAGVLLAVFIYWGWDSTVTVNEETKDATRTPGLGALTATLVLLATYVIVTVAAQAFAGVHFLTTNEDDVLSALANDVLGSKLGKLVIIAVLTSASASTQTTILPTARTSLSMARAKAIPAKFGEVHPRFFTPFFSTWTFGIASIIWYVGLTILSQNVLYDSIAALGLMIAFYYGFTGFACVVYYRRELFKSAKNFFFIGVSPLIGALMLTYLFLKSAWELASPSNSESGTSWFGVGPPLAIIVIFMLIGVIFMIYWSVKSPAFFKRKRKVVDPGILTGESTGVASFAAEEA